ncbi:MAG: phenylalanine--tRNA ligase subunit alpha [Candidatus Krumholzibacteriota bacterium]|nr:phenylalanine--tRNA ligase subunit alpha [Candidatus Krumholzibacteriota bacterium]
MKGDRVDRERIAELEASALRAFRESVDEQSLDEARVRYLGRKGLITSLLRSIGTLSAEERPVIGELINAAKTRLQEALDARNGEFACAAEESEPYPGDPTLPGRRRWEGGLHILHRTLDEVKRIFAGMGYSLAEGPDVELDYYNFEALNFPPDHPSRDLQDTFYVNDDILLRTQTSPVQVRFMEKHDPPLRIIAPGRVYRSETPDPSHAAEFHQVEGLCVDRDISLADLRNDVTWFVQQYFGSDARVRFRPHFFPFTEPSAEADMTCFACGGAGCSICQKTGWIEIMGAGMVHPNVFRNAGYDPDAYTGFAFGMGIDRVAMLKYGIDDIRLFLQNDLRFLGRFWNRTWSGVIE